MREARDLGAPEEVLAQIEAEHGAGDFSVWEENWRALNAFLFVSTQWRTVSLGGGLEPGRVYWVGLDYGAIADSLPGAGFKLNRQLWSDLHVMEAAAKNTLNGIVERDDE